MKKKIIITLSILVALVAAWLVLFPGKAPWKMFRKTTTLPETPEPTLAPSEEPKATGAKSPTGFISAAKPAQDTNGFPLQLGSRNDYVKNMQEALNKRFGSELVVDGIYGAKTEKVLKAHGYNNGVIYYKHYFEIVG